MTKNREKEIGAPRK